jgi:outer membrane protein TolC
MTQDILMRQLDEARQGEAVLSQAASHAESAYQSRAIDSLAYANLRNAWLAKQIEIANLRQTLIEQRIALLTLIGGEVSTGQ